MGHGSMGCGMKTMRFIMVLFNIVFFFVGAALLALGIYVMVDPRFQKLKELLSISTNPGVEKSLSYLEVMAIAIIVLGSILLIVGFLGCCGAMKQVKIFLVFYGIIVGLIILAEVGVTIYFVAFQSNFKEHFVPKLQQSIKDTYEGPLGLVNRNQPKPSPISLAWDFVMYNLKCCGAANKFDFLNTSKWNRVNPWWNTSYSEDLKTFRYPLTCCPIMNSQQNWNDLPLDRLQQATECAARGTNIYEIGCYDRLIELLNSAKTWVIVAAVIILVVELCAFIFTLTLCCRERKDTIYYSS